MEEIRDAHGLEREIMDDARKKAERIVRSRDRSVEENRAAWKKRTAEALEAIEKDYETKQRQLQLQNSAALPLDRKRAFLRFAQDQLERLVRAHLDRLDRDRLSRLLARYLAGAAEVFGQLAVSVRYGGIDDETARTIVEQALPSVKVQGKLEQLAGVRRACIFVATEGDRKVMECSVERIEQELLTRYRQVLADALFKGNTEP